MTNFERTMPEKIKALRLRKRNLPTERNNALSCGCLMQA